MSFLVMSCEFAHARKWLTNEHFLVKILRGPLWAYISFEIIRAFLLKLKNILKPVRKKMQLCFKQKCF
jgi:hypothetical protein